MRRIRKVFSSGSLPAKVVAAGMILLFLSIVALAASPALHEWIHSDAKDVDHHCVITALAHGQLDASACDVSAPVPNCCFELASPVTALFSCPILEFFPPGRAPPFCV